MGHRRDRADRRADGRAYKVRLPFFIFYILLLTYFTIPTAPLPPEHEKHVPYRVFFVFYGFTFPPFHTWAQFSCLGTSLPSKHEERDPSVAFFMSGVSLHPFLHPPLEAEGRCLARQYKSPLSLNIYCIFPLIK